MMSERAFRMILPLPRPQYVPVPEAFITALAWRKFNVELKDEAAGRPVGLMFRPSARGSRTKVLDIQSTAPEGDRLVKFAEALNRRHLRTEGDPRILAEAVLNSVAGVRVEKSGSQPASPITPAFALLQNIRGLQGVRNPPDLAEILETLYELGSRPDGNSSGVADLWLTASQHRMAIDELSRLLDGAVDESILGNLRTPRHHVSSNRATPWRGELDGSPFEWFKEAWDTLTQDVWVEALPARVWVDWATTVLRLALGLGYLWESAWYDALARQIIGTDKIAWPDVRGRMGAIIPWKSSRAGKVALDVAPQLSWRVFRGDQIRGHLSNWVDSHEASQGDFESVGYAMRNDVAFSEKLVTTISSNSSTPAGKNLWEAVKYALKTRDASGAHADYYGLLRTNARYLTVDPGTEWIAVVASLSCGTPGGSADVGRVLLTLEKMGMRPELSDLIALLEKAGIARGSADADQGVIVQSAF
ncbi:MAG: hypothetical protein ACYCZY_01180 [Lacisediminihabitans sp.]